MNDEQREEFLEQQMELVGFYWEQEGDDLVVTFVDQPFYRLLKFQEPLKAIGRNSHYNGHFTQLYDMASFDDEQTIRYSQYFEESEYES